ncbi:MAG: LPS-assembly protein LptD, partial [Gammaproteobacteria bacterium]
MISKLTKFALRLTPLLLCLTLPLSTQAQDSNQLDWSPIEAVPEELQDEKCQICKGRYMDPLAGADQGPLLEEQDITASATSTEMSASEILLSGGVMLQQGSRTLQGDEATLDRITESGTLSGNIVIREPGVLLRGEHAEFSSGNSEAVVTGSQFVLHQQHIRGNAESLRRDGDGLIYIEDGDLSYCPPGNDDWALSADNIELNLDEGVGTARGARIKVKDTTVFYFPWMSFPLDDRRKTGFLWPEIGSDSKGGLNITAP